MKRIFRAVIRFLERFAPTSGEMGSYSGMLPLPPLVQMVVYEKGREDD